MKKITQKMINEFSKIYLSLSGLKIEQTGTVGCWEVKIDNAFIKYANISLSDLFYQKLEEYFNEFDIKLSYNNTGTIFWTKNEE